MRIFTYALFIFLVFIFSVFRVQGHGLLHPEALERIPNYLDERSIFQKVYDIDRNEYGLYQARELSHFFDYIDANFIKLSASVGLPHFYSLIYFISIFIIIVSCLYIAKSYFNHKNFLIPSLIILIFLFSAIPFFSPYMFRSAKILVALGMVFTMLSTVRFLSQKLQKTKTYLLVVASALFLAFGDRQGFYVLLILVGFIFLIFLFFRNKEHLKLFKFLSLGIVFSLIYSYIVAPLLIKIDIGHFPSFSYHKIGFGLIKPIFFRYSTLYSLDVYKYFFGNLNRILVLFFLLIFLEVYITSQAEKIGNKLKYTFLSALGILAILFLNTLMILKHNAIPLEDVRRVYYSLPLSTIILLATLYFSGMLLRVYPKVHRYLLTGLFIILVLNVFSLDGHFKIIKNGLLKDDYEESTRIIDCINSQQESYTFGFQEDVEKFCELVRR